MNEKENEISLIQRQLKRYLALKNKEKLQIRFENRERGLDELISTEQTYCDRLKILIKIFANPLSGKTSTNQSSPTFNVSSKKRSNKKFTLSQLEYTTIFQNVEALSDYHSKTILTSLEERLGRERTHEQNLNGANGKSQTKNECENENKKGGNKPRKKKTEKKPEKEKQKQKEKQIKQKQIEQKKIEQKEQKEQKEEKKKENQTEQQPKTKKTVLIGKCFQEWRVLPKLYTHYCEGYEEGIKLLTTLREKGDSLQNFLMDTKHSQEAQNLDLTSFLILPIQRLPRYNLLLSEILKYTDKEHPDYQDINETIGYIQKVANEINQHLNVLEQQRELYELQSHMAKFKVVKNGRRLVRSQTFQKVSPYGNIQKRHFFLFNDVLIYCSKKFSKYKFKKSIDVNGSWIQDMPNTDKLKNAFLIVGQKKTLTVCAITEKKKQKWIKVMTELVDELVGKKNTKKVIQRKNAKLSKKIIEMFLINLSILKILKNLSPPDPKTGSFSNTDVFGIIEVEQIQKKITSTSPITVRYHSSNVIHNHNNSKRQAQNPNKNQRPSQNKIQNQNKNQIQNNNQNHNKIRNRKIGGGRRGNRKYSKMNTDRKRLTIALMNHKSRNRLSQKNMSSKRMSVSLNFVQILRKSDGPPPTLPKKLNQQERKLRLSQLAQKKNNNLQIDDKKKDLAKEKETKEEEKNDKGELNIESNKKGGIEEKKNGNEMNESSKNDIEEKVKNDIEEKVKNDIEKKVKREGEEMGKEKKGGKGGVNN
ncbi:faciogenital dysplasia protein [Anaeramoeba flamelloides]|uniref:Faciogenital dysplasia protein n=1 Tax=Anaeramoeba flamelloides TaxID=1746091 RepID=A0AAV7YPE0_9EUKA|nr:faciogenital dysplasia protein [Anaeramoeba flamelloides]